MEHLLAAIADIAPSLTWKPESSPERPRVPGVLPPRAFVGTGSGYRVVVIDFDIADQGFPEGSRGEDGTAILPSGVIIRLTRPLAKRVFQVALAAVSRRN